MAATVRALPTSYSPERADAKTISSINATLSWKVEMNVLLYTSQCQVVEEIPEEIEKTESNQSIRDVVKLHVVRLSLKLYMSVYIE